MLHRLRAPFFTRQLDADIHTLLHRGGEQRVSLGDRLVALDRIAGTTMIAGAMVMSVWAMSVASGAGLLRIPSATANSVDASAIEAQGAGAVADHLKWSEVRNLQAKLVTLGFDPGTLDGIAGRRTLDALNRYRETKLLEGVTRVDRATVADLLD